MAALAEGAAGAAGSMASILALYPLDTARTILQVAAPPYDKPMGYFELIRFIVKTEGWQRLYRGMPSAISGTGLSWALYFGWNEAFKRWLLNARRKRFGSDAKLGAAGQMLAAAMAGVLTTIVVNPIWVINTRLKLAAAKRKAIAEGKANAHANGHANGRANGHANGHANGGFDSDECAGVMDGSNGPMSNGSSGGTPSPTGAPENAVAAAAALAGAADSLDSLAAAIPRARAEKAARRGTVAAVVDLVRREGLMGWLSGIVPALVLLVNPAIQLLVYARLREAVLRATRGRPPGPGQAALIGALSKFVAVLVTFPAQTMKLRMQAGIKAHGLAARLAAAETLGAKASEVLLLWTGVGSKMFTSMLHSAVMFSVVEAIRALNLRVGTKRIAAPR